MTFDELEEFSRIHYHKYLVVKFLTPIIQELTKRMVEHDDSKFEDDEFPCFVQAKEEFKQVQFGTEEYEKIRAKYAAPINAHYRKNSHHPEHYQNGIEGMDLLDILELIVDWKAASMREKDGGNIEKSIEISAQKYGIDKQLSEILLNTAKRYGLLDNK